LAVARAWLTNHSAAGIEGVVAKRLDQPYRPGDRTWRKIWTRLTADAVVGGVLGSIARPEALIVGRYDEGGRLRVAGRTPPLPRRPRLDG
jgi:ATP-dependent DNA ligase